LHASRGDSAALLMAPADALTSLYNRAAAVADGFCFISGLYATLDMIVYFISYA